MFEYIFKTGNKQIILYTINKLNKEEINKLRQLIQNDDEYDGYIFNKLQDKFCFLKQDYIYINKLPEIIEKIPLELLLIFVFDLDTELLCEDGKNVYYIIKQFEEIIHKYIKESYRIKI
jgi:hypothetical protein